MINDKIQEVISLLTERSCENCYFSLEICNAKIECRYNITIKYKNLISDRNDPFDKDHLFIDTERNNCCEKWMKKP